MPDMYEGTNPCIHKDNFVLSMSFCKCHPTAFALQIIK